MRRLAWLAGLPGLLLPREWPPLPRVGGELRPVTGDGVVEACGVAGAEVGVGDDEVGDAMGASMGASSEDAASNVAEPTAVSPHVAAAAMAAAAAAAAGGEATSEPTFGAP